MHRIDNSKFLLFIEPNKEKKATNPVNDNLTAVMEQAINMAKVGISNYSNTDAVENFRAGSGYKGFHRTDCGETSSNQDLLLENGMITNSLAVFYLQYYRDSIPKTEMDKVIKLEKFYTEN